MPQVWIGLSPNLEFEQLICKYIDPYFGPISEVTDNPVGLLESSFGAGNIEPGDFEVYSRSAYANEPYNLELIYELLPFSERLRGLEAVNISDMKSIFFVKSSNIPIKYSDKDVSIVDVINVKFEWE
jgi:hypothetical protein